MGLWLYGETSLNNATWYSQNSFGHFCTPFENVRKIKNKMKQNG